MSGVLACVRSGPLLLVLLMATSAAAEPARPNILLIVVDTLRYDRVSAYGAPRDSTPRIDELLVRRGAVIETAYAQAPWTLPSMMALFTGRHPGQLVASGSSDFRIAPEATTLAESLLELGYDTAGFSANPTIRAEEGFAKGFETFESGTAESLSLPAGNDLQPRVLSWLEARRSLPASAPPYFLYVQYIDPHDPYESPELVDGRAPGLPGYAGKHSGRTVHALYSGRRVLEDPEKDLAHLKALYEAEVRYVDGMIGELLEAIPAATLASTLVVLTADHGEELFDHGGWKHGQTLYEEQIRVPLLMRWDGRIPAGTRLPGTVRLLDLPSTLVAAAGGSPAGEWTGVDLLPSLSGGKPLPDKPAFAQHLSSGPLRAAVIAGRRKLVLFNASAPFDAQEDLDATLWRRDLARLERAEVYDLASDPREQRNLYPDDRATLVELTPMIHEQVGLHLPGLRLVASGLPDGSKLAVEAAIDPPPSGSQPYFLAESDRAELEGGKLRIALHGDGIDKGVVLDVKPGAKLTLAALRLNGDPLPASALRLGGALEAKAGETIDVERVRSSTSPSGGSQPSLLIWLPGARAEESRASDNATRERLKALGYTAP